MKGWVWFVNVLGVQFGSEFDGGVDGWKRFEQNARSVQGVVVTACGLDGENVVDE